MASQSGHHADGASQLPVWGGAAKGPGVELPVALPSELLREDDLDAPLVTRRVFLSLRDAVALETISNAGSDNEEDEVIPVDGVLDEDPVSPLPPGCPGGGEDKLGRLLAETPLRRLHAEERCARQLSLAAAQQACGGNTDAAWALVRCRQRMLALAKLYSPGVGPYAADDAQVPPMLLADSHFKLAQAYAAAGCIRQVNEHANIALHVLPADDTHPNGRARTELRHQVCALVAESLLNGSSPRPQAALDHIHTSTGVAASEDLSHQELRMLAMQCHALLGVAALQRASGVRGDADAAGERVQHLERQLAESKARPAMRKAQHLAESIDHAHAEMQRCRRIAAELATHARGHLESACDTLMAVIADEEDRLRAAGGRTQSHPLVMALWRQACELMFRLSLADGALCHTDAQLRSLREVLSAHETYACCPASLHARVLKEQGAALVARAAAAAGRLAGGGGSNGNRSSGGCSHGDGDHDEEGGAAAAVDADLCRAIELYEDLLALQARRFAKNPPRAAACRADALRLLGNVHVARRCWADATRCYRDAADTFAAVFGVECELVMDLRMRIDEVGSFAAKQTRS